jgi:hypothetical protein
LLSAFDAQRLSELKPAADNVVVRAVQFEEKGFADLEGAELLLSAGLPEIDFVRLIQPR